MRENQIDVLLVGPLRHVEDKRYTSKQGKSLNQNLAASRIFVIFTISIERLAQLFLNSDVQHLLLLFEGLLLDTVLIVWHAGGMNGHSRLKLGFLSICDKQLRRGWIEIFQLTTLHLWS